MPPPRPGKPATGAALPRRLPSARRSPRRRRPPGEWHPAHCRAAARAARWGPATCARPPPSPRSVLCSRPGQGPADRWAPRTGPCAPPRRRPPAMHRHPARAYPPRRRAPCVRRPPRAQPAWPPSRPWPGSCRNAPAPRQACPWVAAPRSQNPIHRVFPGLRARGPPPRWCAGRPRSGRLPNAPPKAPHRHPPAGDRL